MRSGFIGMVGMGIIFHTVACAVVPERLNLVQTYPVVNPMAKEQAAQAQITYQFEHYPLPPIPTSMQHSTEVQQWRLSALELGKFHTPYQVENRDGRLHISVGNTLPLSYPVTHGQLIFNNRGEWGAQLYFQATGSSNPPLKIKEAQYGNFKKILTLDGNTYVLEASTHLDGYEGGLFELNSTDQGYDVQEVLHIKDSAPVDMVSYQGAWYIICNNSLYVVKDGVAQRYFYFFYNRMEPNSIAVLDEEHIWVGTNNSGIAKFNLKTQSMKFYLDKHQAKTI